MKEYQVTIEPEQLSETVEADGFVVDGPMVFFYKSRAEVIEGVLGESAFAFALPLARLVSIRLTSRATEPALV